MFKGFRNISKAPKTSVCSVLSAGLPDAAAAISDKNPIGKYDDQKPGNYYKLLAIVQNITVSLHQGYLPQSLQQC